MSQEVCQHNAIKEEWGKIVKKSDVEKKLQSFEEQKNDLKNYVLISQKCEMCGKVFVNNPLLVDDSQTIRKFDFSSFVSPRSSKNPPEPMGLQFKLNSILESEKSKRDWELITKRIEEKKKIAEASKKEIDDSIEELKRLRISQQTKVDMEKQQTET